MEDRLTEGLYVELSADPSSVYAAERTGEVLARPEVLRATWWENQRPGRDEYPRTIDDFRTLGVYEVDDGFLSPRIVPTLRGYHFRRCPRPPQGNMSGRPTIGLLLVLVSPKTDAGARALRDWADFQHIRAIAAAGIEGFTLITAYENAGGGSPRFLHLYEMDCDDPEAAFQTMAPRTIERRLGPAGTPLHDAWFGHEQLVIDYINTFRRMGARDRQQTKR